jgi:hypothetical protein
MEVEWEVDCRAWEMFLLQSSLHEGLQRAAVPLLRSGVLHRVARWAVQVHWALEPYSEYL